MSLYSVKKQLRELPYGDMMVLAGLIAGEIENRVGERAVQAADMADILSGASLQTTEELSQISMEDKLLQKIFNRKRVIAVSRYKSGWTVDISTLPAAQSTGLTLRDALNRTLDQITTFEALQK